MRIDTIAGGLALVGAGWFAVHAVLWGVANTLDHVALVLHRAAARWRELQRAKTAQLAQEWVRTLERGLERPKRTDEAFMRQAGISPKGYTGD